MTYGFIGLGNMASAIVLGMKRCEKFQSSKLIGFDTDTDKMQALAEATKPVHTSSALAKETGLRPTSSALEVVKSADIIVLAVKPQILPALLDELKGDLQRSQKLIVTIAAGKKIAWYEEILGKNVPIVRVMPNIAAKVGAACSALCKNEVADDLQLKQAREIFASVGTTHIIEEKFFSAFTALSGSSGAITLMYINAIATVGVEAGFPKTLALKIANEAVKGASELLEKMPSHPSELIDSICSPGGTTIAGVITAKNLHLEASTIQSIEAIIEKDKSLAK